MRFSLFFFFLIISLALIQPGAAVKITLADLNIVKGVSIDVYNNTGAFQGEFNTTDTIDVTSDSVFILKPTEQSWFSNPLNAISLFEVAFPTFLGYLVWFVIVLGSAWLCMKVLK